MQHSCRHRQTCLLCLILQHRLHVFLTLPIQEQGQKQSTACTAPSCKADATALCCSCLLAAASKDHNRSTGDRVCCTLIALVCGQILSHPILAACLKVVICKSFLRSGRGCTEARQASRKGYQQTSLVSGEGYRPLALASKLFRVIGVLQLNPQQHEAIVQTGKLLRFCAQMQQLHQAL